MPSQPESPIDDAIDAGEIPISPKRDPRWGRICGGKTRNTATKNEFCQLPAGYGTDHPKEGRCKFHGGATPRNSGRYSRLKKKQREIAALIEEHELDPQPLDLLPDLAAARALFETFVEHNDDLMEATLAWLEGYRQGIDPPKPKELPSLEGAAKLLTTINKIVATIEKIRSEGAVSRPDFIRTMTEMGRVVETYVEDKDTQQKIKEGWLQIRIA